MIAPAPVYATPWQAFWFGFWLHYGFANWVRPLDSNTERQQ